VALNSALVLSCLLECLPELTLEPVRMNQSCNRRLYKEVNEFRRQEKEIDAMQSRKDRQAGPAKRAQSGTRGGGAWAQQGGGANQPSARPEGAMAPRGRREEKPAPTEPTPATTGGWFSQA
jgi:hypothetical protein